MGLTRAESDANILDDHRKKSRKSHDLSPMIAEDDHEDDEAEVVTVVSDKFVLDDPPLNYGGRKILPPIRKETSLEDEEPSSVEKEESSSVVKEEPTTTVSEEGE